MKLDQIARQLELTDLTPELKSGDREATAGFASDLLSDVLAHASAGSLLVTVQVHLNVIAVAVHADLAGVIFAAGRSPEEPVRAKAVAEGVPLFASTLPAFDLAGRLYAMGVRGV
ncbi:MAG: serine kinase [Phycisphaerae bacterium]|nr:serine kinase [Phycisphaerae bacterium]